MTRPSPKKRYQVRFTIDRAKKSELPPCSDTSTSFSRALKAGLGGGFFAAFALSSSAYSFFCSAALGSFVVSSTFVPVRNIIRAVRSGPLCGLNFTTP